MTTNLDMGGYRILNEAHPRDPSKKKHFESDLVTAKTLYDYMARVDQNYMRRDRDCSLDGRLNMSNHRINDLADPTDANDAFTRRYVASRFQAFSDEVQDNKSKLDALLNISGVENTQVLIRKYELINTDFEHVGGALFSKYPRAPDDINEFRFIYSFTLKEYFLHLIEEPADGITWLKIKQPGTYTIHFDLIYSNSFSFELHTRDKTIHFSEHKPKHDINMEKDDYCALLFKRSLILLENIQKYMFIIIYRDGTKTGIIIANSESKLRNQYTKRLYNSI